MRGASAALERYERFRAGLADRLGVDPDPVLRRVHQELLAADSPIRTGLRYDADELLGRESDLAGLRAALASGRLTTVLGPGGIGKTRIAMVLAREANLPRVHVVELVGVASGDDLIAEVGAVLGVRGSLTSRKALTAAQEADVRARIAQELDQGPTLLVLDNCEHVLEAAASLVAYLLVTTRDLTVLTTSRAPLRIAAERAVPLSLLEPVDAAALFERRARAVRPDAELERDAVAAVVDAARRAAARDRDRRGARAHHVGGGDRPAPGRSLRPAPQPRPRPPGTAPHPERGDRVVVGPARRRGAHRAGDAVGLPGRLRRRGRRGDARRRWSRPGRDPRGALARGRDRGRRRRADADAGDHQGVRGASAGRGGWPRRGPARAAGVGHRPRDPPAPGAQRGGTARVRRGAAPGGEQPHRRPAARA